MNWLLLSLCALVVLLALDATLGRWLLGRFSTTFRVTQQSGDAPESKRLLVYLPGILFDGDESVAEVKGAMMESVANGLFVSYGFWRFLSRKVILGTAAVIGHAPGEGSRQQHTSIVLVGASFGGRLAADVVLELQTRYGWNASAITVVMVDTPCENNSFQQPGLTVSLIVRRLFFGPLVSSIAAPLVKRTMVPPYDVDIEAGLDFASVKRKAVDRMAKFRLSSVADQQRYLADNSIQWTLGLTGIDVVYLWCDHNNITVVQPAAMRKVELFTKGKVNHFAWRVVPSPHCGFGQLPTLWQSAFREVLSGVPQRRI
ncbi:MAG TPA: hypothetical protein VN081_01120 [Dongiaceae bacterium]|nr:hypothetical protein [Dongiaceae bacterium]